MKEDDTPVLSYKKRNRPDKAEYAVPPTRQETNLVLNLKKDELFDPHVLLPHAELNRIIYRSVNAFTEKYKGTEMTVTICSKPVNSMVQDVFREVYRAHYEDELRKLNRYLKRRFIRALALILVSVTAFLVSRSLTKRNPDETIFTYLAANISCFCLWEVGYTQFAARDVIQERKRVLRALNAKIEF